MTKYYKERNRFRKEEDTPISVRNYENDDDTKIYYCNNCNRILGKLIDSSGQNPSWYCNHCSIEVIPSLQDVRSKSKLVTPDGPVENPAVSYPPEPTIGKQPQEIKGAFAALKAKGLRITNYKEGKG